MEKLVAWPLEPIAADARRTPSPPCWAEANEGPFILVPLLNGAAVKVPVCRRHAELIQGRYRDDVSMAGG